jgi:SAM-dependent methyltransferase
MWEGMDSFLTVQNVFRTKSYASLRAGRPPNLRLIRALKILNHRRGRALDIGAGPLNNTRFLLQAGFKVDAVDKDPVTLSFASNLNDRRLNAVLNDIRNFWIEPEAYSLIVAIHVLPFLPRADLSRTLNSIINGLAKNGILYCTFFGVDDSWARQKRYMSFLSRGEIEVFFNGLQPVELSEHAFDGADADKNLKHWHVFRCMFQK